MTFNQSCELIRLGLRSYERSPFLVSIYTLCKCLARETAFHFREHAVEIQAGLSYCRQHQDSCSFFRLVHSHLRSAYPQDLAILPARDFSGYHYCALIPSPGKYTAIQLYVLWSMMESHYLACSNKLQYLLRSSIGILTSSWFNVSNDFGLLYIGIAT
jgi:hypothetical protein